MNSCNWECFVNIQGFVFKEWQGVLNYSPERFKESCQESDSYEHHWIVTILGELNIALLREDWGERRRVIALPLRKNEGLNIDVPVTILGSKVSVFKKKGCFHFVTSS